MAAPQKSSALGAALSSLVTAMEALPFTRGDDQTPSGPRVVRAIVDALSGAVEGDGLDQRTAGVVSHSALVSFLDTIALDIINQSEAHSAEPMELPSQTQEIARPTAAPLASRDARTETVATACKQTSGTVAEFVGALRSLPPGTMASAGSDGIVFARIAFTLCDTLLTRCRPDHGPGVACTKDDVSAVIPLAEGAVSLPSGPRSFNAVRLLGGAVEARRLADALTTCALDRPDALVLIEDRVIATPLSIPCIDLASGAQLVHDSALNPFSLPGNRASLADAWRVARSGASSDQVLDALARLSISSVVAPVSLYRVEGRLYSGRDLLDVYPSMGSDVRDVLFCPVGAPGNDHGAFVLYETPIAESVLAAAYGPSDARVGAAYKLANDARAHRRQDKPDTGPLGIARREVDFDAISQAVDAHGIALVVYTLDGCPHSQQLSDIIDGVAAEVVGVPVLTVEREKIPAGQQPFAYPHIFVARPDGHAVFCSTARTKGAIVNFVKTFSDPSSVRTRPRTEHGSPSHLP